MSTSPPLSMMPSFAAIVAGGGRVIAGDHHRRDAGRLAEADRRARLGARRIEHADQPEERQVAFDPLGGQIVGHLHEAAAGEGQHAQPVGGHLLGCILGRLRIERLAPVGPELIAAQRNHAFGAALREGEDCVAARCNVVMRSRSDSKGISAIRGKLASSSSRR